MNYKGSAIHDGGWRDAGHYGRGRLFHPTDNCGLPAIARCNLRLLPGGFLEKSIDIPRRLMDNWPCLYAEETARLA
jgi:hypothetical protein